MSLVFMKSTTGFMVWPDPSYVSFVAKIQKAKTRKGKDYYVSRITVPKDLIKKTDAEPGDYLFFKAKKAQWYHMLDWKTMENTWKMLPHEIRQRVILDGLYLQGAPDQMMDLGKNETLGATNLSSPRQQMIDI